MKANKQKAGRPTKALITESTTIKAAIKIIDEQGLNSLSVQSVARELGVTAPSLYHHFRNKDEILQIVARTLLTQIGEEYKPASSWEQRLIDLAVATRRVILRHANAAPLMLRFFPRTLMLGAYERTLQDCPYPASAHFAILDSLEKLTYGTALFAAAEASHHIPAIPPFEAKDYPLFAEAINRAHKDEEEQLVETLQVLFDGFRTRYGR